MSDKDAFISETQSKLGLLRHDADFTKNALEQRAIQMHDELQEKSENICELENKLGSLRCHLADSEAINVKKDDSIASLLNKQADLNERLREMQVDAEGYRSEIDNLKDILEDTRKEYEDASERADNFQQAYEDLKNGDHQKVLLDLSNTESKLRVLEDEYDDVVTQTKSLANGKRDAEESLASTEVKCASLQESLATTDGKMQGALANIHKLESENKQLLGQLEEITTKFSSTSHELAHTQSCMTDEQMNKELASKRYVELEKINQSLDVEIHTYRSAEAHVVSELQHIGDSLSRHVDLRMHVDGINTGEDYFTSPAPAVLAAAGGPLSTPTGHVRAQSATDNLSTPAPQSLILRQSAVLKEKVHALMHIYTQNLTSLTSSKTENGDLKALVDRKQAEISALMIEKDGATSQVQTLESEVASLRDSGQRMAQVWRDFTYVYMCCEW
jgi:chromosome segregation ATPase